MASKNSVKQYVGDSYYHIYNRGVDRRTIFQNEQDYGVFLSYLKTYLLPKDTEGLQKKLLDQELSAIDRDKVLKQLRMNNFNGEVSLCAYCLMPNHFHLLIKQKSPTSIDIFMNSLITRYVMYFNRKYKRVGPLFQDVYKAVLVQTDSQLVYLSSYIHRNPFSLNLQGDPLQAQLSSYSDYLGNRSTEWLNCKEILSYFSKVDTSRDYRGFVEQTDDFSNISKLLLEA